MEKVEVLVTKTQVILWSLFAVAILCIALEYCRKAFAGKSRSEANFSNAAYAEPKEDNDKHHPTVICLQELLEIDGAGKWPPRTSYGKDWPEVLRPYHDIYLELAPSLQCKELSSDDEINFARCLDYRVRMTELLHNRVNLADVEALLSAAGRADKNVLSGDAWNGFFACIASSRHAFRWGTIPIVRLAQEEQVIDIPAELDVPWAYLKRRYGVTSQGGNLTSNYLCNFNENDQIVYPINCGMSSAIKLAEYHFAHVFYVMETQALPVYHLITKSIHQHSIGDRSGLLDSLRQINILMRQPLKTYYDTMVESKISRRVWLHYVQGFQGWAAGTVDPITGIYTEYDGLSGNQLLFCHIIDAFLGLDPYLTNENDLRYMPESQRRFRRCVRDHSFRGHAKEYGDNEIEVEMEGIMKQMRIFRSAHRVRVKPYLDVPAPERLIMTAGKSVLEKEDVHDFVAAIAPLDELLKKRLEETK